MKWSILSAFLAVLISVFCVSCGNLYEDERASSGVVSNDGVLRAGIEGVETRTYIDNECHIHWNHDDRISVFYGNDENVECRFEGATGDREGDISPVVALDNSKYAILDAIYALYPYSKDVVLQEEDLLTFTLPAVQSYAEDSFGPGAHAMVAVTNSLESRSLQFRNVCGSLKLQLWGDAKIKSIRVKGNNNETLSGEASIVASYGAVPVLSVGSNGGKVVTLNCGNGVQLSGDKDAPTVFWVVLPPVIFTKGFTVEIEDFNGSIVTKSTDKRVVIERNNIQPMKSFEVATAPIKPANNEIWYTTSDGKQISLAADRFGVAIKSHEQRDDRWVITFESDLTMLGNGGYTGAFEVQKTLTSVVLPDGITNISAYSFYNCSALQSIVLPANLQIVGDQSLYNTKLTTVDIPSGVTSIGNKAFYNTYLTAINVFATTPPTINNKDVLPNISVVVYVPEEAISKYKNHNVWNWFTIKSLPEESIGGGSEGDDGQGGDSGDDGNGEQGGDGGEEPGDDPVVPPTSGSEIWYTTSNGDSITLRAQCFNSIVASHEKRGDKWVISFAGTLTSIGVDDSSTGAFENSGTLTSITIPDSVTKMHAYTFYDCANLHSVKLSDNLQLVGEMSFYNCTSLAEMTLPASIKNIDSAAFFDCSNLVKVNSLAITPPTLGDDVFPTGVTIYVPDSAIGAYLQSPYWKKYTIATLSGDVPDDALIYAPNDPSYTSTDFSADGSYVALQSATEGNGIDIVLMGDGYSDRQVASGRYEADMRKAMEAFFSKEPFTSFRHLFNVYMVKCVSKREGCSNDYAYGETALNCKIKSDGVSISGDGFTVYGYAREIFGEQKYEDNNGPRTDESTLIVIMNSDAYAGVCYMTQPKYNTTKNYGNGNSLSYFSLCGDDELFANLLIHEAGGHGFGKLGDEYYSSGNGAITNYYYYEIKDFEQWGWFKNVDATMGDALTSQTIKWRHFLTDSRYAGLVGIYEGAYSYAKNAYRPSDNSIMRHVKDSDGRFNAPSREAIYYRIHKLAYGDSWTYSFEEFAYYDAINR